MYFLIIATTLSAFLFSFSVLYGENLERNVQKKELQEFTSSALKTILYTTIPRDMTNPNPKENDFLLAGLKEDYFDDESFSRTAYALRDNIQNAMIPLAPAYDYLFYFYIPPEQLASTGSSTLDSFPFFLFYKSTYTVTHDPDPRYASDPRYVIVENQGHTFFFCRPQSISDVDNLLFAISNKSKTSGRSQLLVSQAGSDLKYRNVQADLIVWPSASFPDQAGSPNDVFGPLRCCEADVPDFPASACAQTNKIFEKHATP